VAASLSLGLLVCDWASTPAPRRVPGLWPAGSPLQDQARRQTGCLEVRPPSLGSPSHFNGAIISDFPCRIRRPRGLFTASQTDEPLPAILWERRLAATGRFPEKPLEDAASRRGRRSHSERLAPSEEFDAFVKITVAQGTLAAGFAQPTWRTGLG
jgi:hypothetical protein